MPESDVNYGVAALALTRDFEPDYDVAGGLRQLDKIAARVRELLAKQPDADEPETRIAAINTVLFKEYGFTYDMADFPKQSSDKRLLGNLLRRGKGTCANLPDLYYAVAERLGFPIYMVESPQHAFLRYELPNGKHINVEATGRGGESSDDEYIAEMEIPQKALELGTMMRTLSRHEALLLLVSERTWHLEHQGDIEGLLGQEALLRRLRPNYANVLWNSAVTEVVAGRAEREQAKVDPRFTPVADASFASARAYAKRAAELGMVKPDNSGEYLRRQVEIREARLGEGKPVPKPPEPWDTVAVVEDLIKAPRPSELDWATVTKKVGPPEPPDLRELNDVLAVNRYNAEVLATARAAAAQNPPQAGTAEEEYARMTALSDAQHRSQFAPTQEQRLKALSDFNVLTGGVPLYQPAGANTVFGRGDGLNLPVGSAYPGLPNPLPPGGPP